MGGATELKGPDLTLGVSAQDVVEARPFLGHAHGEAVMLVRSGGKLFATGATCTHYSGPLAEGWWSERQCAAPGIMRASISKPVSPPGPH
jgi:hypothetical protein